MLAYIVLLLLMLLMAEVTYSIEGMKSNTKGAKRVKLSVQDCTKRFNTTPSFNECILLMENRSKKKAVASKIPSNASAKNAATDAANKAKEMAVNAANKAKEMAANTANKAKDAAKDAGNKAKKFFKR